jgi:hypothetical protein
MSNNKDIDKKFFKVLNPEFKHYDYQYVNGLNELKEEFNDDPQKSCCSGRFYVTTIDHISNFFSYGIWLAPIELPTDNPKFKIVKDPDGNKWGVNMLIIKEKYSLFDIKTYEKFGLNIKDNWGIIKYASTLGNVEFLDWTIQYVRSLGYSLLEYKKVFHYCFIDIDRASENNQVKVLNWWKESLLPLSYSENAIDNASINGHIETLEWWKNSGLKLTYTKHAFNFMTDQIREKCMTWWEMSGLKMYR